MRTKRKSDAGNTIGQGSVTDCPSRITSRAQTMIAVVTLRPLR
jgi:hypothetical protein